MSGNQSSSPQWYLIQCKPRQDARAEEHLRNQKFPCYRPVHPVEAMRRGKRVMLDESLFPGYLFINLCQTTDSWHSIRSTRGVARLVTFCDRPVAVPGDIIVDIRQRLATNKAQPLFESGCKVTVSDGPFRDIEAVFCKADGEDRAVILLNLLQREQLLHIPLRALKAAG
ncbi:transcription/translation regulatory transformer protein RfaH [Halopseudomonas nanhaiensis]|uniref:transcription/translation regulatory transformer protein RfaH n=1 Tax=Halopseudomonas nanhaiensis TaxID=2830842 RepID=UPI001CBDA110|nr:transcription/translation regulatory transformer protein RfaH [Halopseudomonas nanhaiensis]UAW99463.1 transcription/translation regulatory transformer protein RfaH [Halopseudomonas nanhaiensis]